MGGPALLGNLNFFAVAVSDLESHHEHFQPVDPIINWPSIATWQFLNQGLYQRIILPAGTSAIPAAAAPRSPPFIGSR